MFCPACGGEFVPGVAKCPDCGEVLVARPESETPPRVSDWVEVRRFTNAAALPLIRGILEERDLPFFLQGEHAFNVHPAAIDVIVLAPEDAADAVREALAEID